MSRLRDTDALEMISGSVLVFGHNVSGMDTVSKIVLSSFRHTHCSLTSSDDHYGLGITTLIMHFG